MTKSVNNPYQPSYIVSQDPGRFGNRQQDYIKRTNKIIHCTAEQITQWRKTAGDLTQLFFEIIATLDAQRAQIAKEHETEDAETFGKRRTDYFPGRISVLLMGGIYQEHGGRLMGLFYKYLKEMECNGKFKKEQIFEDRCNGVASTLHIEVLDGQDLSGKGYRANPSLPLPAYISYDELRSKKDDEWTQEKIAEERKKFRRFKEESPQQYRVWRKCSAFSQLNWERLLQVDFRE